MKLSRDLKQVIINGRGSRAGIPGIKHFNKQYDCNTPIIVNIKEIRYFITLRWLETVEVKVIDGKVVDSVLLHKDNYNMLNFEETVEVEDVVEGEPVAVLPVEVEQQSGTVYEYPQESESIVEPVIEAEVVEEVVEPVIEAEVAEEVVEPVIEAEVADTIEQVSTYDKKQSSNKNKDKYKKYNK